MSLDDVRGEIGTLVVFLANHCPFVIHIQKELHRLGTDLKQMGIGMVGISASDVETYPQDGPETMKVVAETRLQTFPYLFDEMQVISKEFKALCTPDFYLFDKDLRLVYRFVQSHQHVRSALLSTRYLLTLTNVLSACLDFFTRQSIENLSIRAQLVF